MNEYNSNTTENSDNANNMASPMHENLLIDTSQCTDEHCNQHCSDSLGNNNETCGKIYLSLFEEKFLQADENPLLL